MNNCLWRFTFKNKFRHYYKLQSFKLFIKTVFNAKPNSTYTNKVQQQINKCHFIPIKSITFWQSNSASSIPLPTVYIKTLRKIRGKCSTCFESEHRHWFIHNPLERRKELIIAALFSILTDNRIGRGWWCMSQ